jgi:hypothetical protein
MCYFGGSNEPAVRCVPPFVVVISAIPHLQGPLRSKVAVIVS